MVWYETSFRLQVESMQSHLADPIGTDHGVVDHPWVGRLQCTCADVVLEW